MAPNTNDKVIAGPALTQAGGRFLDREQLVSAEVVE
jgi:hypothetical protein